MSVAQPNSYRLMVIVAVCVALAIIWSFIGFEIITHFSAIWQMIYGISFGGPNIMYPHP